ncbi:MAG: hypothetical protein Solivirus6_6 [Solivirus sp.]|uniref:Uncharacterized protein n=1 Tax=Solivirus sp. TaxID=2487772 RepID=A0A3G5AG03_9VIRU|nr:MAG: hypothetical protein Solivirus6_6 [Solivirus sp.]
MSLLIRQMGFETADFILHLVGTPGPVYIDVGINRHNQNLPTLHDTFVIGRPGHLISVDDARDFMLRVSHYAHNPIFNNGRSYYFQGIAMMGPDSYRFAWGS